MGTANATYSDVQNGLAGTGNINANPVFLRTNDLIIVPGSLCVNAGNRSDTYTNIYFPPSIGHKYNDMGAHGGPGAGAVLQVEAGAQIQIFFFGGVPGYSYSIQASTNLLDWQTVEQVQIAHVGDTASYLEPNSDILSHRFFRFSSIVTAQ